MDRVVVLTLDDARDRQVWLFSWGEANGARRGSFVFEVDLHHGSLACRVPAEQRQPACAGATDHFAAS